jgi:hypothetical protein
MDRPRQEASTEVRGGPKDLAADAKKRLQMIHRAANRRARVAGYDAHPDFFWLVAQREVDEQLARSSVEDSVRVLITRIEKEKTTWLETHHPKTFNLLNPMRLLISRKWKGGLKTSSENPSPCIGPRGGHGPGRDSGKG